MWGKINTTLISLMLHIKADMGLAGFQFTKTKYEQKLTVCTH